MMTEPLAYDEVRVEIDLPESLYQQLTVRCQEMGMELPEMINQILLCDSIGEECDFD
jgi:hypothetical protein